MRKEQWQTEIDAWLNEEPFVLDVLLQENGMNDSVFFGQQEIEEWFSRWRRQLPADQQRRAMEMLDVVMTYLATFYQSQSRCERVEREVIRQAMPFNSDVQELAQMRQLKPQEVEFIEEKLRKKYGLYALAHGSVSGTGHPLAMMADFPVLLILNLKLIHFISAAYGYSMSHPQEQVLAQKVLYGATLPRKYRKQAWDCVHEQLDAFAQSQVAPIERMVQPEWLETLARQWVKSVVLFSMRRVSRKKLPLLGMACGAGMNYHFTKQVGQFASYLYRSRWLQDKSSA